MAHSLILGGIRSGKSSLAERLVSEQSDPVVYVATATAGDGEMSERIRRHQRRRPASWGLVEEPVELGSLLNRQATLSPPPCVLIDCMSLWVSNLLHAGDAYFHRDEMAAKPCCPFGLRLFQAAVGVDNADRRRNQARLRELAVGHADVNVFCSHDPVEFARASGQGHR